MKNLTLFVIFIALSINSVSAQKISIGAEFSPFKTAIITKITKPHYTKNINNKFGVTVFLNDKRFQFITGVHLSTIKNKDNNLIFPDQIKEAIKNGNINSITFETKDIFLIIPIQGKIPFLRKSNKFYTRFGLDFWINIGSSSRINSKKWIDRIPNSRTYNKFLPTPNLALGYEFQIFKSVKLFVEPKVEFSYANLKKGVINRNNYFHYGINLGIVFGKDTLDK